MCGGLITQRLRDADGALVNKVYAHSGGTLPRGWLLDLMRGLPEVDKNPMGRDTWYNLSAAALAQPEDPSEPTTPQTPESPSNLNSSPSSPMTPPPVQGSRLPKDPSPLLPMSTAARQTLAKAVCQLLQSAPEGMSGSGLGLRLRRLEPQAVEDFFAEDHGDKKPTVHDLVRSIPGVVVKWPRGGSLTTLWLLLLVVVVVGCCCWLLVVIIVVVVVVGCCCSCCCCVALCSIPWPPELLAQEALSPQVVRARAAKQQMA
ncbi:unnamed protein product [Polarella glacialis]|uniref:HTH OST-type domain-containing protein n=1 Tax=Polarella glacialis TaxID=89957 RepID=A0A813HXL5_POLGL|nr:unnamed protein product [Polarella glacialis]